MHALLVIKILIVELVLLVITCTTFSVSHALVMFIFAVSNATPAQPVMFVLLDILKELVRLAIQDIIYQLTLHLLAYFVQLMLIATVWNAQLFHFALSALLDGQVIFVINVLQVMDLLDLVQHVCLVITLLVLIAILVLQIFILNVCRAQLHQLVLHAQLVMMLLTIAAPALKDIIQTQILRVSAAYLVQLLCLIAWLAQFQLLVQLVL